MQNIVVLWFQVIIFCLLLGWYTMFMPSYFYMPYFVTMIFFIVFLLLVFSMRKKPVFIKGNYLTSTFLFLLSFLIVHFQFYIDYALGLRSDLGVRYYLDYNIVPKAITIVALTINVFLIGNTLGLLLFSSRKKSSDYLVSPSLNFIKTLMTSMLILFIINTPIEYYRGGYGELMNEGGLGYIHIKSAHLIYLSLIAYVICIVNRIRISNVTLSIIGYMKQLGPLVLIIIGLYLLLNLIAGSREPIIAISLILASGYFISQNKRLKTKTFIAILLIATTTFQFVNFFRGIDGDLSMLDRIELAVENKKQESYYVESSILTPSTELASSLRAYHAVVMRQESNDILYGKSNIGYILNIIPGLGLLLTKITSIDFSTSTKIVTEWMGASHGMGTTALADTYLNYGLYGSIVIFLLFGYLLARLDVTAYSSFLGSSPLFQVIILVFISNSIFISRASLMSPLADIITTYIILKVAILIGRDVK